MTVSTAMDQRVYNFSAGPAVLPVSVLEQVQKDLICLPGAGASIMEISHRSKQFDAIIKQAEANFKELLGIGDEFQVLFLQGGASMQFSMLAMNFLDQNSTADYIRCGAWSKKAITEAKKHGQVRVVWDGEGESFSRLPAQSELTLNSDAAYLHMTSNETIEGIQHHYDPDSGDIPLVCDASSDFLHRPLEMKNFDLIYAGAQKNVGPAGCTIVVVRKSFLDKQKGQQLPTMLDYKIMAAKESLYNTPPAFSIYVIELVTRWLLEEVGGLKAIHQRNKDKAQLLYDALDQSGGFYTGHAHKDWRSLMNVTFKTASPELDAKFIEEATAKGLSGLKGHRSVGGLRASIYNAFPVAGVEELVGFMKEFQSRN